ncbi:Hypothetical protein CulFRC58_0199 [Corynebacterium ulcerans FRC58]|uniref:Uncharacterized protein n=1 Tax=Corynebacterium ulcerans FRC58 TaxID=1408268 RepID=A0ABM5TY47_CORUL|nr:Hypothetical protein CulFRC58_0199 [Corynebacterium ulcerans FRC58]
MGYAMCQDFAWRLSRELPQGRNAARVSGLWRVCGVPFLYLQPLPLKQHLLDEARAAKVRALQRQSVHVALKAPQTSSLACAESRGERGR